MGCGSSSTLDTRDIRPMHEFEVECSTSQKFVPQQDVIDVVPELTFNNNDNNGNKSAESEDEGKDKANKKNASTSTLAAASPGDNHNATGTTSVASDGAMKPEPLSSRPASLPQNQDGMEMAMAQKKFNAAISLACLLVEPESVLQHANEHVYRLTLQRTLPSSLSISALLRKLPNLQEVSIANNQIGPQGFRAVMLALSHNTTIVSMNISNNHTDTESAASVGKMLSSNSTLVSLNVSGNYLGKDYFSRCVGPALRTNTSLQILRCESIGSTDMSVLLEGAINNSSLVELQLSHNSMTNPKAFITALGQCIQNAECHLEVIDLKNCGLNGDSLLDLSAVLPTNTSLRSITVSANQTMNLSGLMELVLAGLRHPSLTSLVADDVKSQGNPSWTPSGRLTESSGLHVLSLAGCGLTDTILTSLTEIVGEKLTLLQELNLSNNTSITCQSLQAIVKLTSGPDGSSLQKLFYGMNDAEEICSLLKSLALPKLTYVNLRRCRISPAAVGKLQQLTETGGIQTLILDGIKLSGSEALKTLLVGEGESSLQALSLSNCSIGDRDLQMVSDALRQGLPLQMLKLSNNRITSTGVRGMVDALRSQPTHPLKLVDLLSNRVDDKGAEALCELFDGSNHTTQLQSLNISNNAIASAGLKQLVSHVGGNALLTLVANNQGAHYEEVDMDLVFAQLAKTLGLSTVAETGCCSLPDLPQGLLVRLTGLGGVTGELGRLMDSSAVVTDYKSKHSRYMTLENIFDLSAAFKGQGQTPCVMSSTEWNEVVGANNDAPAWLQLANHRDRAVYVSHLPAAITAAKMEGILDMEADCSVDEVVLMKDIITRKNNGFAWVLLGDMESVQKSVEFFNNGEALVFGQPFVLSRVMVKVDDVGSQQLEAAARLEMEQRAAERQQNETAHRRLIEQSYLESQARHAYRLAHPAYADGRIW